MKYILLLLIFIGNACIAAPMTGFGARYYDEDTETYADVHKTDKDLIPEIAIGSNKYKMESSTLAEIAKYTGVRVNKDSQTTWICLKSKNINYWLISDNEMGVGDLTAIAIAKDGTTCTSYKGSLRVSLKAPMLASKEEISSFFIKPKKDIVMYYRNVKKSDGYTQSNSIMYYLKDNFAQGIFISQGTTS